MNEIKKKLGKKIKFYREQKGLTQEKLAEKIDLSCRSLSFIECGTNFVSAETLEKLCINLEVSPKQLFDFDFIQNQKTDIKKEISRLVESNPEKINDIYKILNGYLS